MSPASLLITDTNIWIDLKNGHLLEDVIRLPYQLMIPDLARSELSRGVSWQELIQRGVSEVELTGSQLTELVEIRSRWKGLSITDVAAFILARDYQAILLTGDERLRKMAVSQQIPVHGLLWLLDEMVQSGVLAKKQAAHALGLITSKNPRLPQDECQKRLARWLGSS
mgnify:CR=1 FL=1